MKHSLRPYVTTGVAIVGASVLIVAPITVAPPDIRPPESSVQAAVAVQPTSLVTDLLEAFNTLSVAGGDAAKLLLYATGSMPGFLSGATLAAIQQPDLIPNLISAIAYTLLSPGQPLPGLLAGFEPIVAAIATVLPPLLGDALVSAFGIASSLVATGLAVLPDPTPGMGAIGPAVGDLPDFIFELTQAIQILFYNLGIAVGGAGPLLPGIAGWVGFAPTALLGTLEAAINYPAQIPGLLSYLAHTVAGLPGSFPPPPSASLFVAAGAPIVEALATILPPPLGGSDPMEPGLIFSAFFGIGTLINAALGVLPAPVSPFPLQMTTQFAEAPPEDPAPPEFLTSTFDRGPAQPLVTAESFELSSFDVTPLDAKPQRPVAIVQQGAVEVTEAPADVTETVGDGPAQLPRSLRLQARTPGVVGKAIRGALNDLRAAGLERTAQATSNSDAPRTSAERIRPHRIKLRVGTAPEAANEAGPPAEGPENDGSVE